MDGLTPISMLNFVPDAPRLMDFVMNFGYLPITWQFDHTFGNDDIMQKLLVDPNSEEYDQIAARFCSTIGRADVQLMQIERLQNPFIWLCYQMKREQFERILGKDGFQEKWYFHGTNPKNIEPICRSNFDWRLAGTASGAVYGQGVYFAENASYSDKYSAATVVLESPKQMFFASVLVGATVFGNPTMKIPPVNPPTGIPYDTSCDPTQKIVVKYFDNEFYPAYIITYM